VLGRGSAVVEALAEGRAAYVYGDDGGDGWVTPERYELLEADGFSGRAEASATTFERLRAELEDYDPALGPAGRELAQAHDARAHAQELLAAFDEVKPRRDPVDAPLRELARVVRLEAAAARRAHTHAREAESARTRATALERELAEARERNEQLAREVEELRRQAEEAAALEEQRLERQKSRRFGPRR
jgi:DNA repair exonuclease SbcCD ATPase subunit